MGVLFSAVTLTAGKKQTELLVAGIPKKSTDLEGWTQFEEFMAGLNEECTVTVHTDAYVYGEGKTFKATPEEVAYMAIRRQNRPDFFKSRCHVFEQSEFKFDWSSKENQYGGNTMTDKVKKLKESYPPGTRLELLHMDDPYAPVPDGTRGTVKLVDGIGQDEDFNMGM